MNIPDPALALACKLISQFEGCRLDAYLDVTGRPTIGYGFITWNGEPVTEDLTITQAECDAALQRGVAERVASVRKFVTYRRVTNAQIAALTSFAWNEGEGALHGSTLLRDLNNGFVAEAGFQFLVWDKAGGRVVEGLLNRRKAERTAFLS